MHVEALQGLRFGLRLRVWRGRKRRITDELMLAIVICPSTNRSTIPSSSMIHFYLLPYVSVPHDFLPSFSFFLKVFSLADSPFIMFTSSSLGPESSIYDQRIFSFCSKWFHINDLISSAFNTCSFIFLSFQLTFSIFFLNAHFKLFQLQPSDYL